MFIPGFVLDFIALRPKYPIHMPMRVMESPAKPMTVAMMLSKESMINAQAEDREFGVGSSESETRYWFLS